MKYRSSRSSIETSPLHLAEVKAHKSGMVELRYPGTRRQWRTAGLDIALTIGELVPQQRIAWSGPAHGIMGVHVWRFTAVADGVLVQTEESWDGEPIRLQVSVMQQALDQSIRCWLESLKRAAESKALTQSQHREAPN
jgi:hypothetical protein